MLSSCVLAIFLLYSSIGFWFSSHPESNNRQYPDTITSIFTPQTIDALNTDPRLRDALVSLTTAIADSSIDVGQRFHFANLLSFGTNLTQGVKQIRAFEGAHLKQRELTEDIGQAFSNVVGGGSNTSGGLSGILKGIGGAAIDSLTTPALFLGIGLG